MIGKRQSMLEVVERLPDYKVRCKCDCGGEKVIQTGHFNAGYYKSCGCHVNRHGYSKAKNISPEYISYGNMVARCHNPNNKRYKDYGAKGIIVCDRWLECFKNFIDYMGDCPEGYQIDRIDNTLGYFPGNCRWASRKQNQQNRSNSIVWTLFGEDYFTAREAASVHGVSQHTVLAWCKGRWARGHWYEPKEGCSWRWLYDQ